MMIFESIQSTFILFSLITHVIFGVCVKLEKSNVCKPEYGKKGRNKNFCDKNVGELLTPHILKVPEWVKTKDWNLVEDSRYINSNVSGGLEDKEEEIAWNQFFRGTTNGLMLELGAIDGIVLSTSQQFEKKFGWRTILIEGDAKQASKIPIKRPKALSVQLVVCEKPSRIHFIRKIAVGGILESMTPDFVRGHFPRYLKRRYKKTKSQLKGPWTKVLNWKRVTRDKNVLTQNCLPLQFVFDHFGIDHINFMVLDLEGGELSALKSLNFDKIRFDVMSIETNRKVEKNDSYVDKVIKFVTGKGYRLFGNRTIGRNSWFVHENWTRSLNIN